MSRADLYRSPSRARFRCTHCLVVRSSRSLVRLLRTIHGRMLPSRHRWRAIDALTRERCCCIGAEGPDLWSRQGGTAISMYASHVSATDRTKLLRQLEEGTCRTHLVVQFSIELSETVRDDGDSKTAQGTPGQLVGCPIREASTNLQYRYLDTSVVADARGPRLLCGVPPIILTSRTAVAQPYSRYAG